MKMRKEKKFTAISLFIGICVSSSVWAAQVTGIDFSAAGANSEIRIQADGPLTFETQENTQDNQVILELKGATLAKGVGRRLDTSSFNSKVSLVSPYQVEGQADTARVVVQLREAIKPVVTQSGNLITINVPNASVPSSAGPVTQNKEEITRVVPKAAAASPSTNLDEYIQNQETKRFNGKPITLQIRDADLVDVFRLIGEASGFNIVVGDDVKGKISLSLVEVPWDQALDTILHTQHLGAERNNNILRVVTLANLTQEKQQELQAKLASEANSPRVTRIFPISYANLNDLQSMLTKFGSNQRTGNVAATGAITAVVQADQRTNSIVIRETPENLDRMEKLIEILDRQTPQVMIEAKVVEATESFSKSLGGSLGIGKSGEFGDPNAAQMFASFSGANPVDRLIGSAGVFTSGGSIASASANGGQLGFSFIPGAQRLNAILGLAENDSTIKIVSSPKTVVLDKEQANIVQSQPVLVPSSTFVAGVGNVPVSTVQQANLSLTVQPTVTNDGSVLMQLTVTKDAPFDFANGTSGISNRNMTTKVLVESGTTLVIGGVYTMSSSKKSGGFPWLRKLPIVGAFFGSESEQTSRSELFIFITPRILNTKESGIAS